jgi:hypothetical protein
MSKKQDWKRVAQDYLAYGEEQDIPKKEVFKNRNAKKAKKSRVPKDKE